MREIVFKMERPGLVSVIEPAVAMSGLFKLNDRLKADHGIVKHIEENERGYYVTVEFEEEEK